MPNPNQPPPRPPTLRGTAPPGLYGFEDETGAQVVGGEGIIPLLKLVEDGQYKLIGTGFFIASSGVFATAKHVLLSAYDRGHPIFTWQLIPPNQWFIRPIIQFSYHDIADVAIGVSSLAAHEETGELLVDTRVRLTTRVPAIGEIVATYAYPNSLLQTVEGGQVLSFSPQFYEGRIVEYLPTGRDRVILPGPCYRTDMIIHRGASGGPVAEQTGRVIGINSTGFDGTDDFYFSRIEEILELEIITEGNDRITIHQLANEGTVTVDP